MKIQFNSLARQYCKYQNEYEMKALEVLRSGWYILGNEVERFESEFADYVGVGCAVGVDNGLNAIVLALKALDIKTGDEVIVPANTYIATIMAITAVGAKPIFIEPNEYYNIDTNLIERSITDRTRAICVVHLYGQSANMDDILSLCKIHNLYLIEDCAQSHGSTYRNIMTGSFGDIACFSFYPGKNLGCFGDGGGITTDNPELANRIKKLRNYGSVKKYIHEEVGFNSRLDEIQAGLLRVKLSHLNELNNERKKIADKYSSKINNEIIRLPQTAKYCSHVWHQYVVSCDCRDKLADYLKNHGVDTMIHYPIPPHLSQAYAYLGYKNGDFPKTEEYSKTILSLPISIGMTDEEICYVINLINMFR